MTRSRVTLHAWLLAFPDSQSPPDGRLNELALESRARCMDLLMDYHELRLTLPPALFKRDGQSWE